MYTTLYFNSQEIRPYETKPIARANFYGREAVNHTSFIRVKTSLEDSPSIVLPVEVEVSDSHGLYLSRELLDFGILKSGGEREGEGEGGEGGGREGKGGERGREEEDRGKGGGGGGGGGGRREGKGGGKKERGRGRGEGEGERGERGEGEMCGENAWSSVVYMWVGK